ncbi:Oidioi.mRNA.OKI2018_I69.XSR.g16521.t1.cds [Oikopleura dioica]|uniref:Oidioi.mRNA.OKI2018_I69.XSR.g16521.t1.cds n=1 Tax=Oikopleura dioica TaxID=34765 RepID=A0ABN7SGD2_OIKDI|nr:Oidioi.mRNA.OKI2018_I69.XSR.g16521.t1.cds [Oikopleura dioica]
MATATKGTITLQGSAQMISEFLDFGINSILFQRNIYPENVFMPKKHYGLTVYMSEDEELRKYLDTVLAQARSWIEKGQLLQLVLVVLHADTEETLERWAFDIEKGEKFEEGTSGKKVELDHKQMQEGMKAVVKQIVSTITFLPLIEAPVMFDLLFYTTPGIEVENWDPTKPHMIKGASDSVKIRSWTSKIHTINTAVTYKAES